MYSSKEIDSFSNVAESLKKYRRAELLDKNNKSILDKLYVDLIQGDAVLKKCLLDNTTYLIGRKGTGKSTIFLKLENEYRKNQYYLPCYIDVKTVFETSQLQAKNSTNIDQYLDEASLRKYMMSRSFIQKVLIQIYNEVEKQRKSFFTGMKRAIAGNSDEKIKNRIKKLQERVENNEAFEEIELPILKQKKIKLGNGNKSSENSSGKIAITESITGIHGNLEMNNTEYSEGTNSFETEFTDVLLKVFQVPSIITELQGILNAIEIQHLVIMLDDVSEIPENALKMFIDTIVTPLNNWSNEFIKFKVAFYPNRVHFGNIDPGKIDIIELDFYNLYSEFDVSKMEENATDFTKRLLLNRFNYYKLDINNFFSGRIEDIYDIMFKVSMNVPRIMGYILSYLHQNNVTLGKKITKQDIENASVKYYDEKIDAFFKASTYCLLSIEEKYTIDELKRLRDELVKESKNIKSKITSSQITGNYLSHTPYSSHFHVFKDVEKYLRSLELNHFISKYEEKSNRDGKSVSIYCLNYGLAKKNNILWGKPQGSLYGKYFIERPFNYSRLILNQFSEKKLIQCSKCGRVFSEQELPCLQFTRYKCPDCSSEVITKIIRDKTVEQDLKNAKKLAQLKPLDIQIVLELNTRTRSVSAKDLSAEIDASSVQIGRICERLSKDNIINRKKEHNVYYYTITDKGKMYCE